MTLFKEILIFFLLIEKKKRVCTLVLLLIYIHLIPLLFGASSLTLKVQGAARHLYLLREEFEELLHTSLPSPSVLKQFRLSFVQLNDFCHFSKVKDALLRG